MPWIVSIRKNIFIRDIIHRGEFSLIIASLKGEGSRSDDVHFFLKGYVISLYDFKHLLPGVGQLVKKDEVKILVVVDIVLTVILAFFKGQALFGFNQHSNYFRAGERE